MKMFQFMIFPNYTEMFDKIDGFIRDYDECLLIFRPEKSDAILDRNRYLIGLKRGIAYVVSDNNAKLKIDLDDDISLEKTLTLYNVVISVSI